MFSERLKTLRINKGDTQKSLADFLEITPNAYRKYEYGEREPDFETLRKLSDYFQVSTDYLLEKSDVPSKYSHNDLLRYGVSDSDLPADITPFKRAIITEIRKLPQDKRDKIQAMLDGDD